MEGFGLKSLGVDGGPDDFLVEWADGFVLEIVVDAHPTAFGDFLLLDCNARSERNETADEVYVGHSVAVAVLVPEADEGVELGFDAGLFTHFTGYGVRKMFAVMEMPSRELEGT